MKCNKHLLEAAGFVSLCVARCEGIPAGGVVMTRIVMMESPSKAWLPAAVFKSLGSVRQAPVSFVMFLQSGIQIYYYNTPPLLPFYYTLLL